MWVIESILLLLRSTPVHHHKTILRGYSTGITASAERIIMAAHVHLMRGIYEPDRKRSKLRKNFTAFQYVSFGVAKRSVSQPETVLFAA